MANIKRLKIKPTRKLIALLTCLIIFSIAGVSFLIVRPYFSATTVTPAVNQAINVSGSFLDAIDLKPVIGATITVQLQAPTVGTAVVTTTNNQGDYFATLTSPVTSYKNIDIRVKEYAPPYPTYDEVSEKRVGVDASFTAKDIDFTLSPAPIDTISTKPDTSGCRTTADQVPYTGEYYHPGDYQSETVNGVLFCTSLANYNQGIFTTYKTDIANNANQIKYLVGAAPLSYTPIIYLTGTITWEKPASAYVDAGERSIVVDASSMYDLSVVTHEFGHLVDWERGRVLPYTAADAQLLPFCMVDVKKTSIHCFASTSNSFIDATHIVWEQNFITGYATTNTREMFAEIFATLYTPTSPGSTKYIDREYLQYYITNALVGSFKDTLHGFTDSEIDTTHFGDAGTTPTAAVNAAMYIYKVVAHDSNLPEFFPGKIETASSTWSYSAIYNGQYMTTAIASALVTSLNNVPQPNIKVTIGGVSGTTLTKRASGVFSNGSGDPINTAGTIVLTSVPIGQQMYTYPGYSYLASLTPGSNPVLKSPISTSINIGNVTPLAVRADAAGKVFIMVADAKNYYIKVYQHSAPTTYNLVNSFGQANFPPVNIYDWETYGIYLDNKDDIYVTGTYYDGTSGSTITKPIYHFDSSGHYLGTIPLPAGLVSIRTIGFDFPGNMYVLGCPNANCFESKTPYGLINIYSPLKKVLGTIQLPSDFKDVTFSRAGIAYVHTARGLVFTYNDIGTQTGSFQADQTQPPQDIQSTAVDSRNYVFAENSWADGGGINIFNPTHKLLAIVPEQTTDKLVGITAGEPGVVYSINGSTITMYQFGLKP